MEGGEREGRGEVRRGEKRGFDGKKGERREEGKEKREGEEEEKRKGEEEEKRKRRRGRKGEEKG